MLEILRPQTKEIKCTAAHQNKKRRKRKEGGGEACKQMAHDEGLNRGKEREGPGLQG